MTVLTIWPVAIAMLAAATAPLPTPGTPRLLLIDIDDVGYDLLADSPTPTLDWIATHGRTFTSFTTSPVCSPTRATVMTGAHPSHPDLLCGMIVRARREWAMPTGPLVPLPMALSRLGVSNAKVGKWHLSGARDVDHPLRCGWQSYTGVIANLGGTIDSYTSYVKVEGGAMSRVTGRYLTTDETGDAIERVRAGVRFVSISYHAAHPPFEVPPPELHSIFPTVDDRDRARAMLQACDREMGRLVREALVLGYTVIVFSDNGTGQEIGGGKGTVFDTGIVAPLWAIGPGIAPGVDGSRIGAVDLYATILDFFGLQRPAPGTVGARTHGPHSRSFLAALGGAADERRWTYSEKFLLLGTDPRTDSGVWLRAVRGRRFKLLRRQNGDGEFLFDLLVNPGETFNLLDAPSLSQEASAALAHFRVVLGRL